MIHAARDRSVGTCVIGEDPRVTLRRVRRGRSSALQVDVDGVRTVTGALERDRDPVRDVTTYHGVGTRDGSPTDVTIVVNCGAPQPYFEMIARGSKGPGRNRVRVSITHEQQDRILELAGPAVWSAARPADTEPSTR